MTTVPVLVNFSYLNEENEIRLVIIKLSSENINVAFNKRKKTIFIKYKMTLSNLAPNIEAKLTPTRQTKT